MPIFATILIAIVQEAAKQQLYPKLLEFWNQLTTAINDRVSPEDLKLEHLEDAVNHLKLTGKLPSDFKLPS